MSRRDTILIAALLNAGLLVVLFTTALKTDSSPARTAVAEAPPFAEKLPPAPARKEAASRVASRDEVDQVLRDYARPQSEQQPGQQTAQQSVTPSAEASGQVAARSAPPRQPSFAEEIKTLTLPTEELAKASAPTEKKTVEVVVKKGDVLEKIARVHQTSVRAIMQQNNLSSTTLQIGQVLVVTPGSKESKTASKEPASEPKYYTVKSGDNPWTIAVKNQMKVDELLRLNHLDEEKARRLRPGDQIRIR